MKQTFKKYIVFTFFLSCLCSGFLGVAQTDDESLDSLFGLTEEEITCENLTDTLKEYNNIVKLLENVFSQSLYNMSDFIDQVHKEGTILKSDLENQKQQVDEAKRIIDKNKYQISQKGENILSILQDCLSE